MRQAQAVRGTPLTPRSPTPLVTPTIRLDIPVTPRRHGSRLTTTSPPRRRSLTPLPQAVPRPLPKTATPLAPCPTATGAQTARRKRHSRLPRARRHRRTDWPITSALKRETRWRMVARSKALAQTIPGCPPPWRWKRVPRRARRRQRARHPHRRGWSPRRR